MKADVGTEILRVVSTAVALSFGVGVMAATVLLGLAALVP
jgi:hypothetical protein